MLHKSSILISYDLCTPVILCIICVENIFLSDYLNSTSIEEQILLLTQQYIKKDVYDNEMLIFLKIQHAGNFLFGNKS